MGKNYPQNNLECKFVHQNQNLCTIYVDPLTPHNTIPGAHHYTKEIPRPVPFLHVWLAKHPKTPNLSSMTDIYICVCAKGL